MPDQIKTNGWNEWSRHVLAELIRQNEVIERLTDKCEDIRIEVAMLKVKAGIWGFAAGAVPAVGVLLYQALK